MKAYIDCVHCYLKQAVSCMTIGNIDEEKMHEVLYKLMDDIKTYDRNETPACNSTRVVLKTYELIGNDDPYKKIKKQSNDLALKLYPELKEMMKNSHDRLYDALKIAVAGNVIDLGINRSFDIDGALNYIMESGFSKDDYVKFLEKLKSTEEVLILGDNAGEIVFDRILAEELVSLGKRVVYVVKKGPVLNDSTMEDAIYTGMDRVADVITTGTNFLGVSVKDLPDDMLGRLKEASVIIAKGQANFESLEGEEFARDRIFFLLKIKCEGVGETAGANFGDMVFFTR